MRKPKEKYVVWWKIDNLLFSTQQLKQVGLYPAGQLSLFIERG